MNSNDPICCFNCGQTTTKKRVRLWRRVVMRSVWWGFTHPLASELKSGFAASKIVSEYESQLEALEEPEALDASK